MKLSCFSPFRIYLYPIRPPALSLLIQVAEITEELATLPKRAQLAAAFITYLSAAPEDLRKTCLEEWTKSACLESLYLVTHVLKFQYPKNASFNFCHFTFL